MQEADHILIPLLDGRHALAQIARVQYERLLVFVTDSQTAAGAALKPINQTQILAVFCVRKTELTDSHWPVIGYDAIPHFAPFEKKHLSEFELTDPAIIEAFANAIHGLYPWDGFPDPAFFANMLLKPDTLPPHVRMTADFAKPDDFA